MSRGLSLASATLLLASASAAVLPYAPVHPRQDSTDTNETKWATFDDVTPSPELNWIDCFSPNTQCTKLTVPLDYADLDVGTIDVGFIRYVVSEDAEDMLFNPGGPGSPGIDFATDPDGSGQRWANEWGYNFVSFDPRGTGVTGPQLPCIPEDEAKIPPSRTNGSLGDLTAAWESTAKSSVKCTEDNMDTIAKYIGTTAVVQDLVHFTELQAAAKGKAPEEALINYFGVSYGTVIGQTLAALYPKRLRRVVLSGNVHGVSYYQGWVSNSVDDLNHGVWMFAKLCFEAGGELCKLAVDAESIDEVKQRFDTVIELLDAEGIELGSKHKHIGADEFLAFVQKGFYTPNGGTEGNYSMISDYAAAILTNDTAFFATVEPPVEPAANALVLITAADIAGRYPWHTYEEWKAAADRLYETAPRFAENYVTTNGLIGLVHLDVPSSLIFPGFEKTETSAPILFVSTTADPVTPASSAREMSRLFPGAGVLIVDGPGHSHLGTKSNCADEVIAAYWQDGTVPSEEKWCETSVDAGYYFGAPTTE